MTELLFSIPESLSPKLVWMRKHGVAVALDSRIFFCQSPNHPNQLGTGKTGDEAIIDFCLKAGVQHWYLE